ncbi:MAG: phosphotransferase [Dehalococcoidia bacterium]
MTVRSACACPTPCRRDGDLWASLAETPFALFPYLPGAARALVRRPECGTGPDHRRRPPRHAWRLPATCCRHETFAIAFGCSCGATSTRRRPSVPAPGRRCCWPCGPGQWGARATCCTNLDLLHQLQEGERQRSGPAVLCHTDLHDENLLVDAAGGMAVLDWDDAKVALPENRPAVAVSGEDPLAASPPCSTLGHRAGGAALLHADSFAFYLLRHYLEDAAALPEPVAGGGRR